MHHDVSENSSGRFSVHVECTDEGKFEVPVDSNQWSLGTVLITSPANCEEVLENH